MGTHVAVAEISIHASPDEVWSALIDPEKIKEYMFGSEVVTDWTTGGSIVWRGEYDGKEYEDRGEILEIAPPRRLEVTHFSPSSGREDVPENYHTILYELEPDGARTHVTLSQDNNASEDEAEHSRVNWKEMLSKLRDVVERS